MSVRKDPPYYEIDQETRDMLEAILNMIGGVADLQADDDSREDVYALGDEVATRFGVPLVKADAIPGKTVDGEEVTVLRFRSDSTEKSPPKLTVVSDNTDKPRSGPPPENDNKS
tara:strand:+ start:169 stop:510 length:342 start_codon:yes stop_codon:yes gene_type:complete